MQIFECVYVKIAFFVRSSANDGSVMRKLVFATAMTSVHNWFLFLLLFSFSEYEYLGNSTLRMTQLKLT